MKSDIALILSQEKNLAKMYYLGYFSYKQNYYVEFLKLQKMNPLLSRFDFAFPITYLFIPVICEGMAAS